MPDSFVRLPVKDDARRARWLRHFNLVSLPPTSVPRVSMVHFPPSVWPGGKVRRLPKYTKEPLCGPGGIGAWTDESDRVPVQYKLPREWQQLPRPYFVVPCVPRHHAMTHATPNRTLPGSDGHFRRRFTPAGIKLPPLGATPAKRLCRAGGGSGGSRSAVRHSTGVTFGRSQ